MKDKDKTNEQLVRELVEMRQRVAELEKPQTRLNWTEELMEQHSVCHDLILESLPNAGSWSWEI